MFGFFLLDFLVYLLLAVLASYIAIRIAKSKGAAKRIKIVTGAIAFLAVWLIPFWDWLPTVVYHKYLCNSEAGVKIYRSVEGVEGFLAIGTGELTLAEKWGYRYVDMNLSEGVRRPRKNESGGLPLYFLEPPSTPSTYGYKYEITRGLPWHVARHTHTTHIIATGEILGTFVDFSYTAADPNVSMSEWRKPWLNASSCYHDGAQRARLEREMVLKTLKPLHAAKN